MQAIAFDFDRQCLLQEARTANRRYPPGTRRITAHYRLSGATLTLALNATTDTPTLMNLAQHGYWNLDGSGSIGGHLLREAGLDWFNPDTYARALVRQLGVGQAEAKGAEGIVVDRLEDVGPALKKAIDMQMNERKTCVIEIMCTRELGDPFRRDALSKPVRFLDKYKDYV